ncbi:hypothetical protein P175DRAFT_0484317 [Aspergillus ochraceoroseus IBT 24754]|uniref:DEUBAD domain-containing protein n=1 Tax=Aspergillus ochraceoroseus IBT 24754 TaxID=1392256 RepID=A0A2T5LR81_9EURO|nr:uncharacterized protein P175DRAFT_0484317 [Aspergillus ochraceoroseus IBT 24754]PTU18787.1 hypothetical protein P175DRAFT_0484317 [Aspergillus ochraceoroseus IBT 24754]
MSSSADAADPSDVGRPRVAMASTESKPKRNPRRTVKDRWEEQKLMSSDTSQLIDLDIVRLLALPEAWGCLEEDEKKEILNLLPSDVHPNPHLPSDGPNAKIPPLPESFLRYSNHWRDGIRNFQLDLQNGRYDPGWLREAEEAIQQRAEGQFDNFKDREFEEFWGQKQKMDRSLAAGQSSRVKLSKLIEHEVIRKGDVWKYSKGFTNKGCKSILVEKEARIVDINDFRLTFAVPPGQRVFLATKPKSDTQIPATTGDLAIDSTPSPSFSPKDPPETDLGPTLDAECFTEAGSSNKRDADVEIEVPPIKRRRGRPRKVQPAQNGKTVCSVVIENKSTLLGPINDGESLMKLEDSDTGFDNKSPGASELSQNGPSQSLLTVKDDTETEEVIISNVQGPTALSAKILEVDGRVKNPPNGNAWKEIRSYRDNQDMGTLWEIRQAWYVKNK